MYSMTGYGKSEVSKEGCTITVECKSVNNRYLDLNIKLPRVFVAFEDSIRKTVSKIIKRGRVDIYINFKDLRDAPKNIEIDYALARAYIEAKNSLCREFEVSDDFTVVQFFKTSDIVKVESNENYEVFLPSLIEAVDSACNSLATMRKIEGENLKLDILARVCEIENQVNILKSESQNIQKDYESKLRDRIKFYLDQIEIDENKLANELAFYADKINIDEEITRLYSHIKQLKNLLNSTAAEGRKLDFLVQEFNREANTICSKSNNLTVTNCGLNLKCEIEKIREQVQNVE